MNSVGAFIALVILLIAFSIWRSTRVDVNVVTTAPTRQLTPVIKEISISSDQEKQKAGLDYPIVITEPSMSPVVVSITRESTKTQYSTTFDRPLTGLLTTRMIINQGGIGGPPLPVSIQIKWTSEVSTAMTQIPASKRWLRL